MKKRRELFASVLDPDRSDVNDLIDNAQLTGVALDNAHAQIAKLRAQIKRLTVALEVQAQMLIEAGVLDREELEARIEQQVPPPLPAPPPAGEMPATIRCMRCERDVAPAATVMTADGPICDPRCAR